ncbi:MAG: hypothetical protein ACKOOI_12020, partial [Pirellula sp.]
ALAKIQKLPCKFQPDRLRGARHPTFHIHVALGASSSPEGARQLPGAWHLQRAALAGMLANTG